MIDASVQSHSRRIGYNYILLIATIVASVALSLVSAYETYLGLLDFMGREIVGHVASTVLTFGIQILLFAISWSIANHIRDGFRANIPRWIIWTLCAFFSGYFSYFGFLETTGGRNEDIRLQEIRSAYTDVFFDIDTGLENTLDEQHQTQLIDSPEYKDWRENALLEIISLASNAEEEIAEAARSERAALLTRLKEVKDILAPLEVERRDAAADARIFEDEQIRVQQEFEGLTKTQATLKADISTTEGRLAALQQEYESEIRTGVGPRAREIRADINSTEAALNGLRTQLEFVESDLRAVQEEKARIETIAEDNIEIRRLNDLDSQIAKLQAEVNEIDSKIEESDAGVSFDFDQQEGILNNRLAGLVRKDYSQFQLLVDQCNAVKTQLSNAGLQEKVDPIVCSNPLVVRTVDELTELKADREQFVQACMESDDFPEFKRVEDQEEAIVNPAIEFAIDCVRFESDRMRREQLINQLEATKTQRGDNVDPMTMARVALFNDQQGNAVMSAIFAIIVDVLVLFCALVGRNVGLPERARAIDLLMSLARPVRDGHPNAERQIDLDGIEPNKRAMLDSIINDLLRMEMMEFSDDGGIIYLKRGATAGLRAMRRAEIQEAADMVVPAATAAAPAQSRVPKRRGLRR